MIDGLAPGEASEKAANFRVERLADDTLRAEFDGQVFLVRISPTS